MKPTLRNWRAWVLTFALAAASIGAFAVFSTSKGAGITQANCDRLVEGMTQDEVEFILNCPPGDYTDGRAMFFRCGMRVSGLVDTEWIGLQGTVWATFREADGRLVDKIFLDTYLWPPPNLLDRVKRLCSNVLGW